MAAITFACGAPVGGAVHSTLALAEQAVAAGHEVRTVVADRDPYARLPRLTSALVRLERGSKVLGAGAWRVHDRLSANTSVSHDLVRTERASDLPSAVQRWHEPGALLVVNSVRRLDLGRLHAIARRTGSPIVWYLREAASLVTLAASDLEPDALIANSKPLAAQASDIWGRPCAYVPSVISREGLVEPMSREVLLAINPIASHGLDILLALAEVTPDRRYALQESWPLSPPELRALEASIEPLANVELRRATARSEVYRDAWALLLPHAGDQLGAARPRVALESQLLGVPVVAHAISGLSSATASDELLVAEGAGVQGWTDAIARLELDYDRFCTAARAFADREMPSAAEVWRAFAAACPIELT